MNIRISINKKLLLAARFQSLRIALCIIFIVPLPVGCNGNGRNPDTPPNSVPSAHLTLLTINLRGVVDETQDNPAANWMFRFDHIGSGLKAAGAVPDVIALQEVTGWMWCTFNHHIIQDYTPLDYLLIALKNGTGVQYRIAYLNALSFSQGNFHLKMNGTDLNACQAMSGLALLYNPNRIRNLMVDTPTEDAASAFAHDAALQEGAHLQRSLPICNPANGILVSPQIDGPSQTDKCNRETPGGLAWITGTAGALARLEFVERPGTKFHVYNVHVSWTELDHPREVQLVNAAVSALEERFGPSRWIPPIIMGDFNTTTNDPTVDEYPTFDAQGRATRDDWILSGKPESFPASANIVGHVSVEMPRVPPSQGNCHGLQVLWSDHCAVLTTLTIE